METQELTDHLDDEAAANFIKQSALEEIQVVCLTDAIDDANKVRQILAIVRTTLDSNYVGD